MSITKIPDWQTKTPQQLVDYANSHHETTRPMRAQDLRVWLNLHNIAALALNGGWDGPLPDIARDIDTPHDLASGIRTLLSHLLSPGSHEVDTHLAAYGPLLNAMVQALNLTASEIESLYALGGGRKFVNMTLAEAESQKAIAITAFRATNAAALFKERMTPDKDPNTVFAGCWEDSLDGAEMQNA